MPAEFHFVRPEWLLAVPFVLLAAWLLARRTLSLGSWQRVVDPALVPYVLSGRSAGGGGARWWLLAAVGVIGAVALAGPAWQRVELPVFRSDQALVIALDLSRSMDAEDVAPSRVRRARLKILDILERRQSGQTALVVYSANAFTVTPLTSDTDTIAALVGSLGTDIMPSRGSYPIAAINKGRQLLEQGGAAFGEILLITDGGASPAAERIAGDLLSAGYTLSVLGVGTPDGAPIPKPSGGFVTDPSGRIAVPKLEEAGLRALAQAGGGRYATLSPDDRDLDHLLSGELGTVQAGEDTLATDQWREEGPWLVLLLLPLSALAFRRGWVAVFVLALLPPGEPVHASILDDLFATRDQQGQKLLESDRPAEAAATFEDPAWRAVAEYRAGNYAGAVSGFSGLADADALYNKGNALARLGRFEAAIEAYDAALAVDPDNEDAVYNRDLLKELLEQQAQGPEAGEQQPPDSSEGKGEPSEGEGPPPEQTADGRQDGESTSEGQPSDREEAGGDEEDLEALREELERAAENAGQAESGEAEETMSAAELAELRRLMEQEQAMEQWLRRIPNDPGGLLRRKFRYQYQRMGRDQDGNNLWPDDEVQPW